MLTRPNDKLRLTIFENTKPNRIEIKQKNSNMKLINVFATVCFLVVSVHGFSQFQEMGTFAGISNYSGDLTEKRVEPLDFNMCIGLFGRRQITDQVALKTSLSRAVLTGADANTSPDRGLWQRNLHFSTELYELAAVAELDLFQVKSDPYDFAPYLFAGVAAFYFNPQAQLNGKTYNLHAYRTEGVEYSLFQYAIPFGGGLKLRLNDKGTLGLECGLRKTFTDYLDDVSGAYPTNLQQLAEIGSPTVQLSYRTPEVVSGAPDLPIPGSQRGNPGRKDWYMLFGLNLGICIGN